MHDRCGNRPRRADLDYVFLGVSSAGTIAGTSRRLKEHNPRVRIIAVDADGSVIFNRPPARRLIPGLGSSITPPLLQHALVDDVVIVSEPETIAACHTLLHRHGLFVGGSTGSAYAAVQRYFGGSSGTPPRVLLLCCDRGGAYLHNIFDRERSAGARRASNRRLPGRRRLIARLRRHVLDRHRTHRVETDLPRCRGLPRRRTRGTSRTPTATPEPPSVFLRFGRRPTRIIALPSHLDEPWQVSGPQVGSRAIPTTCATACRAPPLAEQRRERLPVRLPGGVRHLRRRAPRPRPRSRPTSSRRPDAARSLAIIGAASSRGTSTGSSSRAAGDQHVLLRREPRRRRTVRRASVTPSATRRSGRARSRHRPSRIRSVVFATVAPKPHVSIHASSTGRWCSTSRRDLSPEIILDAVNVVDDVDASCTRRRRLTWPSS